MSHPAALFGYTSDEFTNTVIALRKKVRELGYEEKQEELYTVPHLTLGINKEFDISNLDAVKNILSTSVHIQPFSLDIKEFIFIEGDVAAKFDNTYSSGLAQQITNSLAEYGFTLVVTDYMRLIRSSVKQDKLTEVRNLVEQSLSGMIEIKGVALAGKLLREEDIFWKVAFF